jgi:hypothetical protein
VARPKNIPQEIDTLFFRGVTPLWMPPKDPAIDERYHGAVMSLAEWIGESWHNESSSFFKMRSILINSCEKWNKYDWESDEAWINERRLNARHRPTLARAAEGFRQALTKAPFNANKRELGLYFLNELCAEPTKGLTNVQGIAAVERAVERFAAHSSILDRGSARFGPIEYSQLPKQLPHRKVAVALSLADTITIWRRDGLQNGTIHYPHSPNISKITPWKAIAEFASANLEDMDDSIDANSVQTLVMNLAKKVSLVH